MTNTISELNQLSLSKLGVLFRSSPPVEIEELDGAYCAEFIGPLWLRSTAGPTLSLTGLQGWWGKEFLGSVAYNLIETASGFQKKSQMQVTMELSPFDGKRTAKLSYSSEAPLPWRYVTDELRRLDETRVLAMTYVNRAVIYKMSFPFVLTHQVKES